MEAPLCSIFSPHLGQPGRNAGIIESFLGPEPKEDQEPEPRILHGASLMVNETHAKEGIRRARKEDMPVFLELNYTRGTPASSDTHSVQSLLGLGQDFLGHAEFFKGLGEGTVKVQEILLETRAQLRRFTGFYGGAKPHHVISNQHVIGFPSLARTIAPLLAAAGVRFVHLPAEDPLLLKNRYISPLECRFLGLASRHAQTCEEIYRAHGIATIRFSMRLTLSQNPEYRREIFELPLDGVDELVLRPGKLKNGSNGNGHRHKKGKIVRTIDPASIRSIEAELEWSLLTENFPPARKFRDAIRKICTPCSFLDIEQRVLARAGLPLTAAQIPDPSRGGSPPAASGPGTY